MLFPVDLCITVAANHAGQCLAGPLGREYSVIAPQGLPSVPKFIELAEKARGTALPELAWRCIRLILAQLEDVHARIGQVEREIMI